MQEGRIVEIGEGKPPAEAEDLEDVAFLPGLVNAHTHLEFSDCKTPIGQKGVPLHDWIGQVIAARGQTTLESKAAAIGVGLREMHESGTWLAGEITTPPCDYPQHNDSRQNSDIELLTFAEVLGLDPHRSAERFEAATAHNWANPNGAWSPHAPYSTTLETIDACIDMARKQSRPLAMHVAESPAERELLSNGSGPLADVLRSLGVWRDDLFPWGDDPFGMLIDRLSKAPRALLVHGNDLNNEEIRRLQNHPNITVVYCPRTHCFFEYEPHPVERMLAAGIRVALGTDSRASNPDLNLWREVQFLLKHRSDLAPDDVIRMATLSGADALGRSDLGRIEVGCRGGFGMVATQASTINELYADLGRGEYVRC